MSFLSFALNAVGTLHPEYQPFINFVLKNEDKIGPLADVARAAASEGGSAVAAVKQAAPDLVAAIERLVHVQPGTAPTPAIAQRQLAVQTENFTRSFFDVPPLSPEEEADWMDAAAPAASHSDSRDGSG